MRESVWLHSGHARRMGARRYVPLFEGARRSASLDAASAPPAVSIQRTAARWAPWQVVAGPGASIGAKIGQRIGQRAARAIVLLKQREGRSRPESMRHRSVKWVMFPLSFKALLEIGKRAPAPRDVKIDNRCASASTVENHFGAPSQREAPRSPRMLRQVGLGLAGSPVNLRLDSLSPEVGLACELICKGFEERPSCA